MLVSELIQRAYLSASGKSVTLDPTSTKYVNFLALANVLQDDWLAEPDIQWNSRHSNLALGTITSDRVTLDATIYEFSKREDDPITITYPSSTQKAYYSLVSADELYRFGKGDVCAIIQNELVFAKTFTTTDPQYGGIVTVPVTLKLPALVSPTATILVDSPNWLAYMMAAEQVRNTVTKSGQYANLIAKANNLMTKMKQANESQVESVAMYPTALGESV